MSILDIFTAVVEFNEERVAAEVNREVAAGTDVHLILNDGLISAMDEVGRRFSEGDLYVPEMLMAARAMKGGLHILKPHLGEGAVDSKGTVVIGTVKGDLHDIGKNLVAMMLEGAGFAVVDLGIDVDTETFVSAAGENNAHIVAISALLTTTMPAMEAIIQAMQDRGLRTKIIVGGAPVTGAYAEKIGADGYSEDAPGAVELARRLVST
jgi:5-methyltetrahydrofolate--homocysteine methyltransferase